VVGLEAVPEWREFSERPPKTAPALHPALFRVWDGWLSTSGPDGICRFRAKENCQNRTACGRMTFNR